MLLDAWKLLLEPIHVPEGLNQWEARAGLMRMRMLEAARLIAKSAQLMRYDLAQGNTKALERELAIPSHEIQPEKEALCIKED